MKRLERKHPLAIRWFHWINFPALALMIWSGALIYWANHVYLYSESLFKALNLEHRLAEGMSWHFVFGWVFVLNGILYVGYTIFSGEWRYLVPGKGSLRNALQVTLYDLHLSKYHPPVRKYNGAQQIAYTAIVLMGIGSAVTGLAIYKPTQLSWLVAALGGYQTARLEHFILTVGYILFFLLHVAQVIRAGWNNFRAMITGLEVVPVTALPTTMAVADTISPTSTPPPPPEHDAEPPATPEATSGADTESTHDNPNTAGHDDQTEAAHE